MLGFGLCPPSQTRDDNVVLVFCFLFLKLCISLNYTNVPNFNFSTGGTMHYGDCNPHGIDTILNRRTAAAAAALNSLTSNTNSSSSPPPPSNLTQTGSSVVGSNTTSNNSAAPGSVNPYFKLEDLHQAAAQAAVQVASQQRPNVANASMYWPGIQGLISNPNVWRDRFNGKIIQRPIKV